MSISARARAAVEELRSRAADLIDKMRVGDQSSEEVQGAIRAVDFDVRRLNSALLADDLDGALRGANSLIGVDKGIADTVVFWKMQDVRTAGAELSDLAIKVAKILRDERGGTL